MILYSHEDDGLKEEVELGGGFEVFEELATLEKVNVPGLCEDVAGGGVAISKNSIQSRILRLRKNNVWLVAFNGGEL